MRIKRNSNYIFRNIQDEYLLIPLSAQGADLQRIYHLNESAADIWQALKNEISIENLIEKMSQLYKVDPEELAEDIQEALDDLIERGFIQAVG